MASSKSVTPSAASEAREVIQKNLCPGPRVIANLEKDPAKLAIWKSQVLIRPTPSSVHVHLGPYNVPALVESYGEFFPSRTQDQILATMNPIDAKFLNDTHSVFRISYPVKKDEYIRWFERVESVKGGLWRSLGIHDLISLSVEPIRYNYGLILAALHFWHPSTSTFHTRLGMISPTLFDLAAITGTRPDGDIPDFQLPDAVKDAGSVPDMRSLSFDNFMDHNRGIEGSPVTDKEHVAFLLYWLSKFAFCGRSIQVLKSHIPLALALNRGEPVALGSCLLASLYEGLHDAYVKLKKGSNLANFCGPLWFLQLWLNAIFAKKMNKDVPDGVKTNVAGYRLAYFSARVTPKRSFDVFKEYMGWFFHLDEICADWAPFANRDTGPSWFVGSLVDNSEIDRNQLLGIWSDLLIPKLIYTLPSLGGEFKVFPHNPHFCARQYGLVQGIPTPFFVDNGHFLVGHKVKKVDALKRLILEKKSNLNFELLDFKPRPAITSEFSDWWRKFYQSMSLDEDSTLLKVTNTSSASLQDVNPKKRKGTHVAEIQAFERYFKTVYNPMNLESTISEASEILKEKSESYLAKYPGRKYVNLKFPPFPSAPFGLAIRLPGPEWSRGVSGKLILSSFTKPKKSQVTWTKRSLSNYDGPLYGSTEILTPTVYGKACNFKASFCRIFIVPSFRLILYNFVCSF